MPSIKVTTPPTTLFPRPQEPSKLSLYDKGSPDKNLFNSVDEELIRLSGSQIEIYKYYPSEEFDEVYMESRQKTIAQEPIIVFGHYDPRPIEENLTQFGVEIQHDQIFTFNKTYIQEELGREIIAGDVLKPLFQDLKFEVFEVQEDSFAAYGIYHLLVHAKVLRDVSEIHDDPLLDSTPNIGGRINDI